MENTEKKALTENELEKITGGTDVNRKNRQYWRCTSCGTQFWTNRFNPGDKCNCKLCHKPAQWIGNT